MQVRCPHCLVPYDSVEGTSWNDLLCPSCGGRFSPEGVEATCTYRSGVRVMGRFELLEEAGTGHFGSVWKARDTQLQRTVAVKIPRRRDLGPQETEMFLRDARAAAQLRHPRIASVHEVGREDDTVYIVTDFIDGANLSQWLSGRTLSSLEAAELVIEIADALHHAHEMGVVHRDLKPSNIMIDRQGEPHVIDFGLARREVGEITLTIDGAIMGTPAYMSPEQARGEGHHADGRSDIYSLGVILFRLLTGEIPFRGEVRMQILQTISEEPPSPRKLNADVSRDLETITLKCLEKDCAKRFQSARELADDLNRYVRGEPIKSRPVGRAERVWRWAKRHPELAIVSSLLFFVLLGVATVAPFVAVHEARLRQESESRRIELQNQVTRNLASRAYEEYGAGRADSGIAMLAGAYEQSLGLESSLQGSIRRLMPAWIEQAGVTLPQDQAATSAAFSPDGHTAIIGGHNRSCTARLWNIQTLAPFGEPLQHAESVRAVAFSPDGNRVLTGSQDGTAQQWDARTGRPIGKPLNHAAQIWAVAFSPDGKIIATGGKDNFAKFWNSQTGELLGEPLGEPPQQENWVTAVAFSPDGRVLVTGDFAGDARFWNVESKLIEGPPIQLNKPIYAVAFTPDGSKIVTAGADNSARLWDAHTREPVGEPLRHDSTVYTVAFSHDGRTLLTGCFDDCARLWDVTAGQQIGEPMRHGGYVMSVAFSPDDRSVLTGCADRTARLWNFRDVQSLAHEGAVRAAVFSPVGDLVLTGGDDRAARLWNSHTGQPVGAPLEHAASVTAVTFTADGRTAITGCSDGYVHLWDARTAQPIGKPWVVDGSVRDIQVCSDQKSVLVQFADQSAQLCEFSTGRPLGDRLTLTDRPETVLAESPDGRTLLLKRRGGTAPLWDTEKGQYRTQEIHHDASIMDAKFSADGRRIVTAGYDQEIRIWNADTAQPIGGPLRHDGIVKSIALGTTGKILLSGSSDQTARCWDLEIGLPIGTPLQHPSEVIKVALSRDGHLALTICQDGSARLWDLPSCKLMTRPLQYELGAEKRALIVQDGTFNADGSAILFRCSDDTARLYRIPPPLPDDPKIVSAWGKVYSGYQLDSQNVLHQLSQADWLESQRKLQSLEKAR